MATLERMRIEVYLFTKYVDDVNIAILIIPKGWYWTKEGEEKWKLIWREEQQVIDEEAVDAIEQETFRLTQEEVDRIILVLLPSNNQDGICPILDLKVWKEVGDGICVIRHIL